MNNLTLKVQLEGLRDIGLDRVNRAVDAVFGYIEQVETASVAAVFTTDTVQQVEIAQLQSQVTLLEQAKDQLNQENRLLRAELAAVRNAISDPTAADATPSAGAV